MGKTTVYPLAEQKSTYGMQIIKEGIQDSSKLELWNWHTFMDTNSPTKKELDV
jgi:hypothetical protein